MVWGLEIERWNEKGDGMKRGMEMGSMVCSIDRSTDCSMDCSMVCSIDRSTDCSMNCSMVCSIDRSMNRSIRYSLAPPNDPQPPLPFLSSLLVFSLKQSKNLYMRSSKISKRPTSPRHSRCDTD